MIISDIKWLFFLLVINKIVYADNSPFYGFRDTVDSLALLLKSLQCADQYLYQSLKYHPMPIFMHVTNLAYTTQYDRYDEPKGGIFAHSDTKIL